MRTLGERITDHLLGDPAIGINEQGKNVAMCYVLNVAYILFLTKFLAWLWPWAFDNGAHIDATLQFFLTPEPPLRYEFFMACIAAPLWEELAFRVIPFSYAKKLGREFILPTLGLTTLLFGWGHGQGTISLLIQGVGGLFMAYTYLKNGYSYWSSVALHFTWNFSCILLGW